MSSTVYDVLVAKKIIWTSDFQLPEMSSVPPMLGFPDQ